MCDCRARIEGELFEKYKPIIAEKGGTIERVSLNNYAMIFNGPVSSKQYIAAEINYAKVTTSGKNPGRRVEKTETVNIVAAYCMFCGEKHATEEDEAKADAEGVKREG